MICLATWKWPHAPQRVTHASGIAPRAARPRLDAVNREEVANVGEHSNAKKNKKVLKRMKKDGIRIQ
jgi:hypothetical protein